MSSDSPGSALPPVALPAFSGPLDLLLHLIRVNEVSITDIPIARITEQYTAYLDAMRELDLDVASDYIVMAAELIQIKSRMLLPRPDAQALLRHVSADGEVLLRPPHPDAVAQLDFLKASRSEAAWLDVPALRQRLTLLITDGSRGSTLLAADRETHVELAALEGLSARRIYVHINNTNPVLVEGSAERRRVEAAGWEIATDGMEIAL